MPGTDDYRGWFTRGVTHRRLGKTREATSDCNRGMELVRGPNLRSGTLSSLRSPLSALRSPISYLLFPVALLGVVPSTPIRDTQLLMTPPR